jgi:hypothetical protein
MKRLFSFAGIYGLAAISGAYAQINSIHSAVVTTHVFNDVTNAVPFVFNNYPSFILIAETGVSAPTGFANRDVWNFSNNGTTPYALQNGNYFYASFQMTLTGNPISPRKEAGFLFSTVNDGDIQFIVNTDGHEVVQFGGISFYSFTANNIVPPYNSGQNIDLAMQYFLDGNGKNALQFFANGHASPVFEFGPTVGSGATDIGNGSTLGGYFQIANDPNNPSNNGNAIFYNISIVPEPSSLALFGLGSLALLLRRRR